MKLLAFDTSTERLAVGLVAGGVARTRNEAGGALASTALLPAVQALMAEAGLRFADLDAIAFGGGPGAFTGLRTACSVAQGLGLGAGRPLLALDSLLVVAEDACPDAPDGTEVGVAMDARMDEVYAGRYRRQGGRWQVRAAPALYTLPALAAAWADMPPPLVAGSALAAFGARLALPAAAGRKAQEGDRAAALLRLAAQAFAAGEAVDAAAALPLYLRDKVALTTEERAAARAAAP